MEGPISSSTTYQRAVQGTIFLHAHGKTNKAHHTLFLGNSLDQQKGKAQMEDADTCAHD